MTSKFLRYSIQCTIALIGFYFLSGFIGLKSGILNLIIDLGILFLFQFLYFKNEVKRIKPLFGMTAMITVIYLGFKFFEFNFFDPGTLEGLYASFRSEYTMYGRPESEVNQGMDVIKGLLNKTTWPILTSLGVFINGMIAILGVFIASKIRNYE